MPTPPIHNADPAVTEPAADAEPRTLRGRLLEALGVVFPPVRDAPADPNAISSYELGKAASSYRAAADELGGLAGKAVLDFGCGWGGETLWLAGQGADAVGCDISEDAVRQARRFAADHGARGVSFVACNDRAIPLPDGRFDAVLSTNVFEHVMQPTAMLREIARVLRPGGRLITRFGPLFYSPRGYHLCWVTQVPWAHLLLGRRAVIEVRNRAREPIHPASWEATGLNRITFGRFRRSARAAGLGVHRLRRVPVRGCGPLAHLPLVGDLVTFGVDAHLVKPASAEAAGRTAQTPGPARAA